MPRTVFFSSPSLSLKTPRRALARVFMKTHRQALAGVCLSLIMATAATAEPAVIYDAGGKFDKSFNEAAYRGIEDFTAKTGVPYQDFEITSDAQREQAFRRLAARGADPIIGIGFAHAAAIERVAKEFPQAHFVIVDSVVDLPNVQSIVFKEEEGSYLVGVLAAMATKSDKVGFIGGMDIPLISKFGCGYRQGVKAQNSEITIFSNMTGSTPSAWNDPTRGGEIARAQFDRGADVIFAAAGGTGLGVYQAAVDRDRLAIGVDSNQNHLHPGTMLTSMVKRVDVAVMETALAAHEGRWMPGVLSLGIKEGGVDWALDQYNRQLITKKMEKAIDRARAGIVSGEITVHDYMKDSSCPVS